jgi:hypothetical protein
MAQRPSVVLDHGDKVHEQLEIPVFLRHQQPLDLGA